MLNIFDLLVLFIGTNTLISIFLLSQNKFSTLFSIVISILLCISFNLILRLKISFFLKFDSYLLVILALALFLRIPPYQYLSGGQDQGLYIMMSKQYQKQGGLNITNNFQKSLDKNQLSIYNQNDGGLYAGIGIVDQSKSIYQMSFYPVHPIWMAMFAEIISDNYRAYSLTMFSVISIIAFYLISLEISPNNNFAARLIALLLAVNPFHIYFSKLPVTEIVALAFSSLCFYYLIRFYSRFKNNANTDIISFILSLLSFNAFFYTRMTGLLFIPFFVLLLLLVIIFVTKLKLKRYLFIYFITLLALFIASNLFYLFHMPLLFFPILDGYTNRLGSNWPIYYLVVLFLTILITLLTYKYRKHLRYFIVKYLQNINLLLFIIPVILVIINLKTLYIFGFTNQYHNILGPDYFKVVGSGLKLIRSLPLFTIMLSLSPPLFILYFFSPLFSRILKSPLIILVYIFSISFLFYNHFFLKTVDYLFYWSRYFVSEVIPYGLLWISLLISTLIKTKNKYIFAFTISTTVTSIIYFLFFSYFLQLGPEGSNSKFFNELTKITNKTLVYVDKNSINLHNQIFAPLVYYYGQNIFRVSDINLVLKPDLSNLSKRYDSVFMLSGDNKNLEPNFTFVDKYEFDFNIFTNRNAYFQSILDEKQSLGLKYRRLTDYVIPTDLFFGKKDIYLYKLN